MPFALETATPAMLEEIDTALSEWQQEGAPVQLHPGDVGFAYRVGAEQLASELRVWRRDGEPVALGAVDIQGGLVRMAIAPSVDEDAEFATRLLADLTDPATAVLRAQDGTVEARAGTAFRDLMHTKRWAPDMRWTPLRRVLDTPVGDGGVRIEALDATHAPERLIRDRVAVIRAAFERSTMTVDKWRVMAQGPAYRRARCLVAYESGGQAVAATTVWSAGEGRPGLIEPLGAHPDVRGRGFGRAITLAAAAALQEMGASSATVCTPSANVIAVAAYVSAGFQQLPDSPDFRRPTGVTTA